MILAPPPAPPAIVATDPASPLVRFLAERLATDSDPELCEALRRTWEGSPSFRETLAALYREQPKIILRLKKNDSESFGDLHLTPDPRAYPLELCVQWRGVRRGLDLPEPWLASLLFALLEVSRTDSVVPTGGENYHFGPIVQRRMWNFQALVRRELRTHDHEGYRTLALDGEHLYWNVFPRKPKLRRN